MVLTNGMDLNLGQSLVDHFLCLHCIFVPSHLVGRAHYGFCGWVAVLISPLGVLLTTRCCFFRLYIPHCLVISAVIPIDSIGPPPAPGLWYILKNASLFRPLISFFSPYTWYPRSVLLAITYPNKFLFSIHFQCLFYFLFRERFKHTPLVLPCYLASLSLWIVAWLYCKWTIFSLSILQLGNIWIISSFWLLWI